MAATDEDDDKQRDLDRLEAKVAALQEEATRCNNEVTKIVTGLYAEVRRLRNEVFHFH